MNVRPNRSDRRSRCSDRGLADSDARTPRSRAALRLSWESRWADRPRSDNSTRSFTRASINCSTMARNSSSTFGSTSSDLRAALRLTHEYAPMLAPNQLSAVTTPRVILLSVRTITGRFRDLTASDAPLRCVEEIEPSAEQARFALNLPFCRTSTYCAQVSSSMTPALVNEARTSPTMYHSWGSLS